MKLSCDAVARWLPLLLDGERAPIGDEQVAAHLAECAHCRAFDAEQRGMRALFSRATPVEVPPRLIAKVERATSRGPSGRARIAVAIAVAASAALFALSRGIAEPPPAPAPCSLADAAALHHEAVLAGVTPLDIASNDPEAVASWFRARLPFELELPSRGHFWPLGGRLIEASATLAAYVLFDDGRDEVSLAVAAESAVPPPRGEWSERFRGLELHFEERRDLSVISWSDRGLTYALVSKMPADGRGACQVCHGPGSGLADVGAFAKR